jgi:hypothetical protein
MKDKKRLFYIFLLMLAVVPLGLLTGAPAWGEWDNEYYQKMLGFIPEGIKNAKSINAFMSDYSVKGLSDIAGYYISAIVGAILVFGVFYIITKVKKDAKSH